MANGMCAISPEDYELALLEKIRLDFMFATVLVKGTEHGTKEYALGRYSRVKRQLDVAAYRLGEHSPFLIADAKRHKKRLDVTDAEAFIGMVDDVGAGIGILVSPKGFSKASVRRAKAAANQVMIMTIEQALAYKWLPVAREIYPYDWGFHENLAHAVRSINEGGDPEIMEQALDTVPYDEWDAFVRFALDQYPSEAKTFLAAVAKSHADAGWRFNAVQHLIGADLLHPSLRDELLTRETDADTIELLRECR